MNALEKLSDATRLLAEVKDAKDAKKLSDMAAAAEHYARKAKLGEEAVDYAHAIKIEALAMLGEFLKEELPHKGGRPAINRRSERRFPTRKKLGVTNDESAEAQALAEMKKDDPGQYAAVKARKKSVKAARRERKRKAVSEAAKLPGGKYRVIYADPPWQYGDGLTEDYGAAHYHYPSMSIPALCLLPISEMCEENAVLFLWVTSPLLEDAFQVIAAWGFRYKTSFVWDKVKHNMGHYNSVRHEFLLVSTRGSCLPDVTKLFDSVVEVERGEHSEKPERFREIVDTIYPNGRRVELFARRAAKGWERWGNQSPKECSSLTVSK